MTGIALLLCLAAAAADAPAAEPSGKTAPAARALPAGLDGWWIPSGGNLGGIEITAEMSKKTRNLRYRFTETSMRLSIE